MAKPHAKTRRRRGAVLLIVAGFLMGALMLMAMVVDLGFLSLTKAQLQAAGDSAALAGGSDLIQGLGISAPLDATATQALARQSAVSLASSNRAGERSSVYCNSLRDVRFGNAVYNSGNLTWTMSWGTQPYNLIGVTLLRNQAGSTSGDGPLPLFFSGLLGASANLSVTASAALMPAATLQIPPGMTSSLLPVAVNGAATSLVDSWKAAANGTGTTDSYSVNPTTNRVTNGTDGIKEFNLYPTASFGLANLGAGNAANDIARQIDSGITAADLANVGFPNGFTATPSSPAIIEASDGLKASLKDNFDNILGKPRAAVLYETTTDGNFRVIGFVGLRIVNVQLTGNNKVIWAQPTTVVDATFQPGLDQPVTQTTSAFAPVVLIQ